MVISAFRSCFPCCFSNQVKDQDEKNNGRKNFQEMKSGLPDAAALPVLDRPAQPLPRQTTETLPRAIDSSATLTSQISNEDYFRNPGMINDREDDDIVLVQLLNTD